MRKTFIFIFILLYTSNLTAQITLLEDFESKTLENQMEIFSDSSSKLNIEDILKNKAHLKFAISIVSSPSFGYDTDNKWVHFQVKNISPKSIWLFIRIYRTAPDIADFFLCYQDRVVQKESFDWKIPFYNRKNPSKITSAQFLIDSNKKYDIYILIKHIGNTSTFPIHLLSNKVFHKLENYENLFYGVLVGIMLLSMIMSFFLFTLSKEPIYFYYSFYSLSTTLTLLSIGGYLTFLFGYKYPLLTGPRSYLFYILGFISFNILFTHSLFDIRLKGPKWLYIVGKIIVFFCLVYACVLIIDFKLANQIKYLYLNFLFGIVLVLSIIIALMRGDILAKFYFVAFVPLITFGTLLTLSELGVFKSNNYLPLLAPSLLFEITVLLIGLAYRLYDYQRKKQALEKKMVSQQIQTQETERQRLAQDLHDDLGGTLSAIKGKVANEMQNSETLSLVEKAIEDLRSISRNLLPPELAKNGLSKAIQQSIERLQSASKIAFTVITFGKEKRMSEERELNIYRVISELLNNIVKHSKATKTTVQVIFYDKYLHISVEDNGVGIKTDEKNWGIGLKNVNSRIEFLKAKLLKDSNENGTTFIVEVSYK